MPIRRPVISRLAYRVYKVHIPTNALFIKLDDKLLKFTLKSL